MVFDLNMSIGKGLKFMVKGAFQGANNQFIFKVLKKLPSIKGQEDKKNTMIKSFNEQFPKLQLENCEISSLFKILKVTGKVTNKEPSQLSPILDSWHGPSVPVGP